MNREDELIARVRTGLTGRTVTIESNRYGKCERTVARVSQGINLGSRRQHVTLYYKESGHEIDFAEMYPENAVELLDQGITVINNTWTLTLKQ